MENIKKTLYLAAFLCLASSLPASAQLPGMSGDPFGCLAPGMMGPCPPPTSTNCTQSVCPLAPPADTTLGKLDPCNPPRIPCANYDPAKNPPENKDGWTKTPNGYISNACTIMECVPQNCATSPSIPPCAAEKKAKDDAAKAEKLKAQQAADQWAKDHANLNGDKTSGQTSGTFGVASADAPGGAGATKGDGLPGAPAPSPNADPTKDPDYQAGLIAGANDMPSGDTGTPSGAAPAAYNYGGVSAAAKGLEGNGTGKAAGEAFGVKTQSRDLAAQAQQSGEGTNFFSKLWRSAAKNFDGITGFSSANDETLVHKNEALESRRAPQDSNRP